MFSDLLQFFDWWKLLHGKCLIVVTFLELSFSLQKMYISEDIRRGSRLLSHMQYWSWVCSIGKIKVSFLPSPVAFSSHFPPNTTYTQKHTSLSLSYCKTDSMKLTMPWIGSPCLDGTCFMFYFIKNIRGLPLPLLFIAHCIHIRNLRVKLYLLHLSATFERCGSDGFRSMLMLVHAWRLLMPEVHKTMKNNVKNLGGWLMPLLLQYFDET